MKIQLNTDKNIQGTEKFESFVSEKINHTLKRFTDKITRIEIHLSDQNAHKSGSDDIQCKIEARFEGLKPLIVTDRNSTKEKALDNAIDKMKAALETMTGKLKEKKS
jgi:ribosomal subunit interface protein